MIENLGWRHPAPSGAAPETPPDPAREKIVQRPETQVIAVEAVEKTAQTGPRPAFRVTYLERVAAYWPEEPDPPITRIDYAALADRTETITGKRGSGGGRDDALPTIDIRR